MTSKTIILTPNRLIQSTEFDAPDFIPCQEQDVAALHNIALETMRRYPHLINGVLFKLDALPLPNDVDWMGWDPLHIEVTASSLSLTVADINGGTIDYCVIIEKTTQQQDNQPC